jgi:hypothetical protein
VGVTEPAVAGMFGEGSGRVSRQKNIFPGRTAPRNSFPGAPRPPPGPSREFLGIPGKRKFSVHKSLAGLSVSEPCNMHPATLVPRRAHRVWVAVSAQFIGSGRIPIRAERYVLELICKLKSSVAAGVDLYLTNSCTRGLY